MIMTKLSRDRENILKRKVKNITGIPMKKLDIQAFGYDAQADKNFITYGYYESNYNRAINKKTYNTINY
jgi:hypothetical protein